MVTYLYCCRCRGESVSTGLILTGRAKVTSRPRPPPAVWISAPPASIFSALTGEALQSAVDGMPFMGARGEAPVVHPVQGQILRRFVPFGPGNPFRAFR